MLSRSQSFGVLRNAMSAYALRLKVLANNIANVDTPGFLRSSVSFEDRLAKAQSKGGTEQALDSIRPEVQGDNVAPSVEEELLLLTETQMKNHVATRAMHEHFATARMAITGRTA